MAKYTLDEALAHITAVAKEVNSDNPLEVMKIVDVHEKLKHQKEMETKATTEEKDAIDLQLPKLLEEKPQFSEASTKEIAAELGLPLKSGVLVRIGNKKKKLLLAHDQMKAAE